MTHPRAVSPEPRPEPFAAEILAPHGGGRDAATRYRRVAGLFLAWVGLACACVGRPDAAEMDRDEIRLTGQAFGTTWSAVFVPSPAMSPETDALLEAVSDTLTRIDALMSTWREDAEIVRFNRSEGLEPFTLSPETRVVVVAALEMARETGGAFDPTVRPLVGLWGFGANAADDEPTEAVLAATRERVGFFRLAWSENGALVRHSAGVELDLSAIAKGYAVDAVVEVLGRHRPAGLLVDIGGEVRVVGTRGQGRPWRLGIQHPKEGLLAHVEMTTGALATSGDYRQRRGEGLARRTHIIDPRSGRSVGLGVASASVLSPTAMEADAVATALMVMGTDAGLAFVEARPWLEAMVVARLPDGRLGEPRTSSGWPD